MSLYDYQGNIILTDESFDYTKYIYANSGLDVNTGLKVLSLTGDTTGMTGDVKKDMTWSFNGESGQCTVKWQGSSSLQLTKKNYSLKLSANSDWGAAWGRSKWGSQKKYVLKANYNEFAHAIYMCSARLWGEVVQARGEENVPSAMWNSLNYGAVDGFPVMLLINNVYAGLYTIMTHKEITTNVDSTGGYYIIGQVTDQTNSIATSFSAHTSDANMKAEADFECVNSPDEDDLSDVAQSINNCIDVVKQAGSDWQSDLSNYLDINAAFDYYIFRALLGDGDGVTKNQGLVCYDGTKWHHTVYDLDHAFAGAGTGSDHRTPESDNWYRFKEFNRVFKLIYDHSKSEFKERYHALRNGPLREANVYNLFANYINDIPLALYVQEDKLWTHTPNSSTASLHQIADWYRLRCQWSDNYIDAL